MTFVKTPFFDHVCLDMFMGFPRVQITGWVNCGKLLCKNACFSNVFVSLYQDVVVFLVVLSSRVLVDCLVWQISGAGYCGHSFRHVFCIIIVFVV